MAEVRVAEKKKGIGDALINLFVVRENEEDPSAAEASSAPGAPGSGAGSGDPAVDDLIARYASGDAAPKAAAGAKVPPAAAVPAKSAAPTAVAVAVAPAQPAPEVAPEAIPAAEVVIDFPAVLRKSGLGEDEQARVERAWNLLHSLPAETPTEIKRQIVGASLQAFGIPIDQILEAALLHIAAYEGYVKQGERETHALLLDGNRRLSELEKEAAQIQKSMQEQRSQQQGLTFACSRQKVRVQEVLDFFGTESVERVKQSSIKLRDRAES